MIILVQDWKLQKVIRWQLEMILLVYSIRINVTRKKKKIKNSTKIYFEQLASNGHSPPTEITKWKQMIN